MENKTFFEKLDWYKIDNKLPIIIKNYLSQELAFYSENSKGYVLDVGTGRGRVIKGLEESLRTGKVNSLSGIDICSKSIKFCKDNIDYAKFSLEDIKATSFKNSSFDTIILSYSIIGTFDSDINSIFNEIKRIIKPNGQILFSTYSENAKDIQEILYRGLGIFIV